MGISVDNEITVIYKNGFLLKSIKPIINIIFYIIKYISKFDYSLYNLAIRLVNKFVDYFYSYPLI